MIKINLLGQVRPKTPGRAVPLESTISGLLLVAALALALIFLVVNYIHMGRDLEATHQKIRRCAARAAPFHHFLHRQRFSTQVNPGGADSDGHVEAVIDEDAAPGRSLHCRAHQIRKCASLQIFFPNLHAVRSGIESAPNFLQQRGARSLVVRETKRPAVRDITEDRL